MLVHGFNGDLVVGTVLIQDGFKMLPPDPAFKSLCCV